MPLYKVNYYSGAEQPLEAPAEVRVTNDKGSVTVSWQAVVGAEKYTVMFTQVAGRGQDGLCSDNHHVTTLSLSALSATIAVGQDVGLNDTRMLRAYTTYAITVRAEIESEDFRNSAFSEPVSHTTMTTSML